MTVRNNVTRLLDSRRIEYQVYQLPPERHSAEETAHLLAVPAEHVYKTIVVLREGAGKKPLLVMTPAGSTVNLRALAAGLGEKKLKIATQREAEALTGLQVGGISALALLQRPFEICLDESATALTYIHISAGQRAANVRLRVVDLQTLTRARVVSTT
jgi:Cys-tRNA(Pro)/Cys-tRNA(Cys) deacylase